ncbi:hypothetical protein B0I35DRAFT_446387 [Stachybotrys elegans]|uniref:Glucose-methanol-choline oxidoreductase N-terminal domain-containing protein n=1 Tax=Stachybotrys elegans TaxID=80388 RepID=A0A8K0WK58_9HYPO|nr:hypothetical protein B0I35DRAFT_446387 [Stachybotrys elegans]
MDNITADYVVVGGGLTGCVVASRLRQRNGQPSVILLEAGLDPSGNPAAAGLLGGLSLQGGELDYAYQSDPEPNTVNRVHTLNAGKVLGGGSILNYGGWLRADAADYNDWAEIVADHRWSYQGLKPWFRKTERYADPQADPDERGFDGAMHISPISASESGERKYPLREHTKRAWLELGVPENTRRKNGSTRGLAEMVENSHKGMRQPAQASYPLDGVQILLQTLVQRVTFSGSVATGVELADGCIISARKEVILCAGAYRTPQLLMLSGIGPRGLLSELGIAVRHDSPYVGQNLHDHFAIYLAFRLRDSTAGYAMGSSLWNPGLCKTLPWDWVVSEPLPAELMSKHGIKAEQERNLWEAITLYVPPGIPGIPIDGSHIATSTMLLRPTSRGKVSIRSNSISDPPRIEPNYLSTALDRDTLVHATRETLKALSTGAMRPIIESETPPSGPGLDGLTPLTADAPDETIEERIRRTGMQHHHSGGTAAMGRVVDTEGNVIGVHQLRIADASIIPIPLGGHPQASLYAMAEQIDSFI